MNKECINIAILGLGLSTSDDLKLNLRKLLPENIKIHWTNISDDQLDGILIHVSLFEHDTIQDIIQNKNIPYLKLAKHEEQVDESSILIPIEDDQTLQQWIDSQLLVKISTAPEVPATLEVPIIAEVLATPEVMNTIETPTRSEVPNILEISTTPEVPITPEVSNMLETSTTSEAPITPEVPNILEIPTTSETLTTPEATITPEISIISETPTTPEIQTPVVIEKHIEEKIYDKKEIQFFTDIYNFDIRKLILNDQWGTLAIIDYHAHVVWLAPSRDEFKTDGSLNYHSANILDFTQVSRKQQFNLENWLFNLIWLNPDLIEAPTSNTYYRLKFWPQPNKQDKKIILQLSACFILGAETQQVADKLDIPIVTVQHFIATNMAIQNIDRISAKESLFAQTNQKELPNKGFLKSFFGKLKSRFQF